MKAEIDKRAHMHPGHAIFSYGTICGHNSETRLIQLTNEVLGTVNDHLEATGGARIVNLDPLDRNTRPGITVVDKLARERGHTTPP